MALRSTYNSGVFGSGLYGEPETTQFSGSTSFSVSASASAAKIVQASSTANIALTASQPSGVIIKDVTATVSLQGIMSISAVTYDVVEGFRPGYGKNTYGSYLYGKNISIEQGSSSTTVSVTPSVSYQVVRQVSASPEILTGFSSRGFIDVVGSSTATISISPNIAYNRIRLFSASDDILGDTITSARYKWLPATEPTTTWTTANYLERAA